MKEVYTVVYNNLGDNQAELYVYYRDGSRSMFRLPAEMQTAKLVLEETVKQSGLNNIKELNIIKTTPELFNAYDEDIKYYISIEDPEDEDEEEEIIEEEPTGLIVYGDTDSEEEVVEESTGLAVFENSNTEEPTEETEDIQSELEKLVKEANLPRVNFAVIKYDDNDVPVELYVFGENDYILRYDFNNFDNSSKEELEVGIILMQLAQQHGLEFNPLAYSEKDLEEVMTKLSEKNILTGYYDEEFKNLLPHMVDANRKMEKAIQNAQYNSGSNSTSVPTGDNDNSGQTPPPAGDNGENNNGNNNNSQDIPPYITRAQQKAYDEFVKKMEKAKEKYYKKAAKAQAKAEEKNKMATMSKKTKRKYKWGKRINAIKNFAGSVIPYVKNILNKRKAKPKKKGGILRRAARFMLIVITTAVIGIVGLFSKDISDMMKKGLTPEKNIENEINNLNNKTNTKNNTKNKKNSKKYKNIKDALVNANINDSKKHAISGVSSFLRDYNTNIAKAYSNGKTKLAHTWNEVMAFYLGVNNIGQHKINDIFDNYHLDASKFLDAFKKGVRQEVQAYIVSNNSLEKENLIETDKGQMFLVNYEKLLTKFKSLKDNSDITRESVANQFYEKVRQDYLSKNAEMKPYKAAALPVIKAMNILTKDLQFENKLNLDERKEVNHKVYTSVAKQLKTYENNLSAYRKANGAKTDDELSYNELKSLVVSELQNKNSYTVIAKKRDITGQKNYKVAIKKAKPTVVENNSSNKSDENSNQETPKKSSNYTISVKKKNKKDNNKNNNSKTKEAKIVDWKVVDSSDDDYSEIMDSNVEIINDFQPADSFDKDYSDIFDDIINNNQPDTDDSIIDNGTIDDSYQDENGNLDNTVKDPTTDSTGAVSGDTSLPDPNVPGSEQVAGDNQSANEVVADQIIDDMVNNPTSSTESIKVFYK